MEYLSKRILYFLSVTSVMLLCFSGLANSQKLQNTIMEIREVPKLGIGGNCKSTNFTLDGDKLQLNTDLLSLLSLRGNMHINGGYIRLMSQDKRSDYMSFPIENCPFFDSYKFSNSSGKEFMLIISGKCGASDSVCTGLWVVGNHQGNYITYVSLDTIRNAGLVFQTITPEIVNGELRLIGIARDRDSRSGYYHGHTARPYSLAYYYINEVRLFWDDSANWFGIRLID